MKTQINPYKLFGPALDALLAYVVGKEATGDASAKKALEEWARHAPPDLVEVDVQLLPMRG